MRRKAASLLLVAMMMSVAVPVHASEQATVTIQESQGENREVDQVQSSETTESKPSTSQITTTAERKEEVTSTHKKKQNKKKDKKKEKKVKKLKKTKKKEKVVHVKIKPTISSSYQEQSIKIKNTLENLFILIREMLRGIVVDTEFELLDVVRLQWLCVLAR